MSALLRIHAVPNARKTALAGRHGDAWKVKVAAPPEDGRANAALAAFLAATLGTGRASIRLVRGDSSRSKVFAVEGASQAEAEAALERASGA
jgi:uncharacterized protein (TIGR00251 family)